MSEPQPVTNKQPNAAAQGGVRPRIRMGGGSRSADLSAMMSALFLAHVGNSVYSGVQPPLIAAVYFPMSILCFYMVDSFPILHFFLFQLTDFITSLPYL